MKKMSPIIVCLYFITIVSIALYSQEKISKTGSGGSLVFRHSNIDDDIETADNTPA